MKKIIFFLLLIPSSLFAQNIWEGSSVATYTTTGNVSIGANILSNAKLRITNTGTYGFYNATSGASTSNQYGIFNNLSGTGTAGVKYGIYNYVGGSALNKYGIYTEINNPGVNASNTAPTAYGLYAKAAGQNTRAGYFWGDVEMDRSNTIYSASNGTKTMLYANFTGSGDHNFSIVFNNTNNQYDWAWERGLELNRTGKMIKYMDSDGMAFVVSRWGVSDVFRVYGDGRVFATEINVKLGTQFPDYVFSNEYNLMPISDLRNYIESNSKLPNMPSAKEVEENGLNIGETSRILVEKIEELTLYLLEQQKLIEQQSMRLKELEEKLN